MLDCATNFRDVADLVSDLGRGRLYRSELVREPGADDALKLRQLGIRLVIDLRGPDERETAPNRWFAEQGVEIVGFDVNSAANPAKLLAAASDGGLLGARAMMEAAYASFVPGAVPALRELGARISGGDLPVLVHCAAGKDRTGFVVAALLAAIGIGEAAIRADYLASAGRLHPWTLTHGRERMRREFSTLDDEMLAYMLGTDRGMLDAAFRAAEERHGSFDAYLLQAGFDTVRREAIRARLLAPIAGPVP